MHLSSLKTLLETGDTLPEDDRPARMSTGNGLPATLTPGPQRGCCGPGVDRDRGQYRGPPATW